MAKLFGCKGYAFPVSFGPKALDVYSQADCKEHGILFLGQKSHAAYACVIPIMHWFSTYDKEYALKNYYDFILNTAAFWEDYLVNKKDKYILKGDAAHEIPYYRGEKFKYITHFGQVNTINAINSLGLVKLLFNTVYDMAKELGLNSEKYDLWEDIIENLADFPTFIKKGKKCFRYSDFGIRWRDDYTVGLQHIYPASQIGLSSDEMLMQGYEGVIRLFPCWKKTDDVAFENLRADGAFLVSAELKDEMVTSLIIKSLMGRKCTVQCSGIKSVVSKADNNEIPFIRTGDKVSFETQKDTEYILI